MEAGDICLNCNKGRLKQIDMEGSLVFSAFSLVTTLGILGDGSSTEFECQGCFKRFT